MRMLVVFGVIWGVLLSSSGFAQPDRTEEISRPAAGLQDQGLYQKVARLLLAGYSREDEKNHTDEMAWMCKALASSHNSRYLEVLDQVIAETQNSKLRAYASKARNAL